MKIRSFQRCIIFVLCALLNTQYTVSTSKSHAITTLINAKWGATPLALEVAEYLADESPALFWDFINAVDSLKSPLSTIEPESKRYRQVVDIAHELLSDAQINLMRVSLSLHSLAPRVQAYQQIVGEVLKHGDCATQSFVMVQTEAACKLSQIDGAFKRAVTDVDIEVYPFDHIYPGSENNSITIVLYSNLESEDFKDFHNDLKRRADNGEIKYIFRHFIRVVPKRKMRLSGYGVELHLKSTEYKSQDDSPHQASDSDKLNANENVEPEVEGLNFETLKQRYPSLAHSLDRFRSTLLEKSEDITPLKAWEFQELGMQAGQRVASIQGEEALQILQFTAQNFPTQAKSLLHVTVSEDFKKEMKHNIEVFGRNMNLQPPDAALFVNGLFFDADTLDTISLLETLKNELSVLDGLHKIGVQGAITTSLLGLDLSSTSKEFAIDIRDSAVLWINDLETDSQYKRWPQSVMDLLRPTFPGMLRNVRKNLFNLILVVDPITPEGRSLIRLAESFVIHSAPVRLGLVFDFRKSNDANIGDYRSINCAFNYYSQKKEMRGALGFLTDIFAIVSDENSVVDVNVRKVLGKEFNKLSSAEIDEILAEESDYDYGIKLANEFVERLSMKTAPQALMNGVPLPLSSLNADDFEEAVLTEIMQQTPGVQKAVYRGDLTDSEVVIDYLMNLPHVMPRLNQRILSADEPIYVDAAGTVHDIENVNKLKHLSNRDMTSTLVHHLRYFDSKKTLEKIAGSPVHFLTIWIVADLNDVNGQRLLMNALKYMKSNGGIRVAFIPNREGPSTGPNDLNKLVWASMHSLGGIPATKTVLGWLEKGSVDASQIPPEVKALLSSTELQMKLLRVYNQRVLKLRNHDMAIVVNGRVFGPLESDEIFSSDDFNLLDRYCNHQYGDKIKKAFADVKDGDEAELKITSDTILKLVSILVPRQQSRSRFTIPSDVKEDHSVVKLPEKKPELPFFDIVAVLDPASRGAQKLSSILILLRHVINCRMRVIMCAVDKHSDMPIKNFYRFVAEPDIQFSANGQQESGPMAKFVGLPINSLLTQNLQVPENWLVEVVQSVYDLDNIKIVDINGPVHSEYELEYLLLEGHCFDSSTGSPPRGLQFTLGTRERPIIVDTIVMANLGYFQLKANPGAWILNLRGGKSSEIYDITSADSVNTLHSSKETRVIISSLKSHVLKIKVTKKPGQQSADLLGDDQDTQGGLWNSITSSIVGGSDSGQPEVLNIFSLASGHLYERLMRIMMLSLLKHTKSPVKFWFLKNYLSPQFIDFLPHMAEEYHFDYEFVQYKWPRWLHQQTEKQRTIWGYKILFLDVLFPLDVKKIIFVDADAIVRADMAELNSLDLGGAPYAYTPFCDSRTDMDGFRFWKLGYWKNHLQGRKYHISALYVVDLKRFRKIAAGDRLRGQYQALSQDPNSLANLDQDLPNNMIHQVPIKSLPQEWLWCQTWCSDDGLSSAKTIDLCNNPQTKEAKLTAAQRIVPEWKDYDMEIKQLINKVEAGEVEHEDLNDYDATGAKSDKNVHSEL